MTLGSKVWDLAGSFKSKQWRPHWMRWTHRMHSLCHFGIPVLCCGLCRGSQRWKRPKNANGMCHTDTLQTHNAALLSVTQTHTDTHIDTHTDTKSLPKNYKYCGVGAIYQSGGPWIEMEKESDTPRIEKPKRRPLEGCYGQEKDSEKIRISRWQKCLKLLEVVLKVVLEKVRRKTVNSRNSWKRGKQPKKREVPKWRWQ